MFGAKRNMALYVNLVAPHADEWTEKKFRKVPVRDPLFTVFPIVERPFPGIIESFLLGSAATEKLIGVIRWVKIYNDVAAQANDATGTRRKGLLRILHIGICGGQLRDAVRLARGEV
jgi:hypothetical protein